MEPRSDALLHDMAFNLIDEGIRSHKYYFFHHAYEHPIILRYIIIPRIILAKYHIAGYCYEVQISIKFANTFWIRKSSCWLLKI